MLIEFTQLSCNSVVRMLAGCCGERCFPLISHCGAKIAGGLVVGAARALGCSLISVATKERSSLTMMRIFFGFLPQIAISA